MTHVPKYVMDEVERVLAHPDGPAGRIRDIESENGFHLIPVGARFPFHFSEADWTSDSVVSQNGKEIRIVLINAISPGSGAFRRLIHTIFRAGFTPVVIAPTGKAMPAIMEKWGWVRSQRRLLGDQDFGPSEEWRPKAMRR